MDKSVGVQRKQKRGSSRETGLQKR